MARPSVAVASSATAQRPGPPWPVRANSKPAGAAPTVILSMAIMMAPVWEKPAEPAHARAHASVVAARICLIEGKSSGLLPSTRNLLDERVLRSAWTVCRLMGSLRFPIGSKLVRLHPRRNPSAARCLRIAEQRAAEFRHHHAGRLQFRHCRAGGLTSDRPGARASTVRSPHRPWRAIAGAVSCERQAADEALRYRAGRLAKATAAYFKRLADGGERLHPCALV